MGTQNAVLLLRATMEDKRPPRHYFHRLRRVRRPINAMDGMVDAYQDGCDVVVRCAQQATRHVFKRFTREFYKI